MAPTRPSDAVVEKDSFKLMRERFVEQLFDVTGTTSKRHWLGGIAELIDVMAGQRQSRLVCFEKLDAWADPIESISAHPA